MRRISDGQGGEVGDADRDIQQGARDGAQTISSFSTVTSRSVSESI